MFAAKAPQAAGGQGLAPNLTLKFCLLSGRFMTIRTFEFGPREDRAPPTKDWLASLVVLIYRDSDEQIIVRSLATTGSRQLLASVTVGKMFLANY